MSKLSDNEKQLLAREVAADKIDYEDCFSFREAFQHGWDAAIEYMEKEREQAKLGKQAQP